jgi:hypothetical protein
MVYGAQARAVTDDRLTAELQIADDVYSVEQAQLLQTANREQTACTNLAARQ